MSILRIASLLASAAIIAGAAPVSNPSAELSVDYSTSTSADSSSNPADLSFVERGIPISLPLRPTDEGHYTGVPGFSCGDPLLPGTTDAPLRDDCLEAAALWYGKVYLGTDGIQTQTWGSCVLAWYPYSELSGYYQWGGELAIAFKQLMSLCSAGPNDSFVRNYAYRTMDHDRGTFSVYLDGDEPDAE